MLGKDDIAITIAVLSFFISALTLYFNFFSGGKLRVSRIQQFYIGGDMAEFFIPKIQIVILLSWSNARGGTIESIFAVLRKDGNAFIFPVWLMKELGADRLFRAAGIKISSQSPPYSHSFIMADDRVARNFRFSEGRYTLEICAVLGRNKEEVVSSIDFILDANQAAGTGAGEGIYFDLNPRTGAYEARISAHRRPLRSG